jgi:hypothetical protein
MLRKWGNGFERRPDPCRGTQRFATDLLPKIRPQFAANALLCNTKAVSTGGFHLNQVVADVALQRFGFFLRISGADDGLAVVRPLAHRRPLRSSATCSKAAVQGG